MKNILVLGAGRSTPSLIKYLQTHAVAEDWHLTIADQNYAWAAEKAGAHERSSALELDIRDPEARTAAIDRAQLVVSMLPAHMHVPVAEACIDKGIPMVTASYISPEMAALDEKAQQKGVTVINEIGVDPGIDHLSAMQVLDRLRDAGNEITVFESFTGGLVAPENDDNPWGYKITWNPRNVVLAGAGGAVKFKQEGKYKYIPYHMLFRRSEIIEVEGYGRFEGYPNRDSLKYRQVYGLEEVDTIFRGTLRRPGFCKAWDVLVKLGMTDDSYQLEGVDRMTFRDFTNLFLAYSPQDSVELKLMHYLNIPQDSSLMDRLQWLGLFEDRPIGLAEATPAQVLQKLLQEKWQLGEEEKDMIVMYHKFGYRTPGGELKMLESSMVTKGQDKVETAMARTVGLPVGIAVRQVLNGNIQSPGVQIPIKRVIYEPILQELAGHGITFQEKEIPYRS
ncbi:MAG: saccharopine dehydrogenase C-terminal domain-containing protein [Schleiferiaceae bacterium]|nr:saccharopine dehydrogenase C-terminal domain-containing protein [Schleiferiaceae bacterium]